MRAALKQVGKVTLAIILIIVGIAGILLPILPGVLPLVAGLVLLGVVERKHLTALREKFKKRQQ